MRCASPEAPHYADFFNLTPLAQIVNCIPCQQLNINSFSAEWSYTFTPQYAFMVWCLVKAQGQLYLYLYFLVILTNCMPHAVKGNEAI
jgi:hypothetical protein